MRCTLCGLRRRYFPLRDSPPGGGGQCPVTGATPALQLLVRATPRVEPEFTLGANPMDLLSFAPLRGYSGHRRHGPRPSCARVSRAVRFFFAAGAGVAISCRRGERSTRRDHRCPARPRRRAPRCRHGAVGDPLRRAERPTRHGRVSRSRITGTSRLPSPRRRRAAPNARGSSTRSWRRAAVSPVRSRQPVERACFRSSLEAITRWQSAR